MLRIKIEIVPYGREEDKFQIDEINIVNDMTGDRFKGNYKVYANKDPRFPKITEPDILIKKFKRSKGARELVRQVLNKLYAKEVKK